MDSLRDNHNDVFVFNEININRLKEKYSKELKDAIDNPVKVCLKLVFNAATNKNPEERPIISMKLSEFLIRPDGIINLFLALIDFDTSSQKVTTHIQRFIAISNIITCLPNLSMPYDEYCKCIFKQLRPLLMSDNAKYSTLASIITKSMLESPHAINKNIPKVIFEPIFKTIKSDISNNICETHEAIFIIDILLQNHITKDLFIDIFPNLFYSFVTTNNTPNRLKSSLKRILTMILNCLKPGAACCLIERTLFYQYNTSHNNKTNLYQDNQLSTIDDRKDEVNDCNIFDTRKVANSILSLLECCENDFLVLEFFFHFNNTMWTANDNRNRELNIIIVQTMLICATGEGDKNSEHNLDLMGIIGANIGLSLELISRTLLNHLNYLKSNQNDLEQRKKHINSSMSSCLEILEVLIATVNLTGSVEYLSSKCLAVLKSLSELLHVKGESYDKIEININLLIEKLNLSSNDDYIKLKAEHALASEYESILNDLNDKLVPVRVHALIRLKQFIVAKEPYFTNRIPLIYSMVESSLNDSEPYVYLAGIKLMSEILIRRTNDILPKLIEMYLNKELDLQHRINIGEVLVQLFKQMNETAPFYSQKVFNTLYIATNDIEELIRMSSLTNIGEICRNLGDSLGKYIIEILGIVKRIIERDTIQVKCAAIDLLKTALSGLDGIKAECIQKELKSVYDLLKKVKCRTLDDKLCLQVDLALDEIDRIARELLLGKDVGKDNFVKNINVLNLL